MYNSVVGFNIRDKIREYEEYKNNLNELSKEISKITYEKVTAGSLSNKTYPGMSETLFEYIHTKLKNSKTKSYAFNFLPYFRYGSINLNSSFKELVYFDKNKLRPVYVKGISKLYRVGSPSEVYELKITEWEKETQGKSNLETDLSLDYEKKNFYYCAILIVQMLAEIKYYNTDINQTIIAKNLAEYLFPSTKRTLTLGIEKINLDTDIRLTTSASSEKKPIYTIKEYDFIDIIDMIKSNYNSGHIKLEKRLDGIMLMDEGTAGKITLKNMTNGFFWKDSTNNTDIKNNTKSFFIRQKSKLTSALKVIIPLFNSIDKKTIINNIITRQLVTNSSNYTNNILNPTPSNTQELIERLNQQKIEIDELSRGYKKAKKKISIIKGKLDQITDKDLFKKYKNVIETVQFMKYDIYYRKKLYNDIYTKINNTSLSAQIKLKIQGVGQYKINNNPSSPPEPIKMKSPKKININKLIKADTNKLKQAKITIANNESLIGLNQYIVFIRKHGGLMDEYGVLDLTRLYKTGNTKHSIMTQFGRTEIEKYLYNSGHIIVQWSDKLIKNNKKWKVLRFDYIFDDLERNMYGKVNKQVVRDKIDKLLTDKTFYIQHTENWIGDHSIKKAIKKFCKETSTSYKKCKIIKTIK